MLQSKLPRSVLLQLERVKERTDEWTVKKFKEVLHHHISTLEACNLQMKLFTNTETDKNHLTSHKQRKLLHMTKVHEASQAKLYFPTKVPNQGMSVSVYFAAIITGVTNVNSIQTSSQEKTS